MESLYEEKFRFDDDTVVECRLAVSDGARFEWEVWTIEEDGRHCNAIDPWNWVRLFEKFYAKYPEKFTGIGATEHVYVQDMCVYTAPSGVGKFFKLPEFVCASKLFCLEDYTHKFPQHGSLGLRDAMALCYAVEYGDCGLLDEENGWQECAYKFNVRERDVEE